MAGFDITIDPKDWSIKVEGQGFQGKECLKHAEDLNKILGARTTSQKGKKDKVQRVTETKA